MKIKEYNLPEWAFLDAHSHLGDELEKRTVLLHIRSASIIELLDEEQVNGIHFNAGFLFYDFEYKSPLLGGIVEKLKLILHYSATLNVNQDAEYIVEKILKPCAEFYCSYATWEDRNIAKDELSNLN